MFKFLLPLARTLPPESAHAFGLSMLKLPLRWAKTVDDHFTWKGLTFRNRIGIAAGFDKDGVALRGLERLGVGFVEVGTILVEPWPGNPDRPRLRRLPSERGIWNKLGFPSKGMNAIAERLRQFPRSDRKGMLVACNIGPHPGHLKSCTTPESYLELTRTELLQLVEKLHSETDFFVINLSSPNTAGLRGLLSDPRLTTELIVPVNEKLKALSSTQGRTIPLLMKLPPDNPDKQPWTTDTLQALVSPILEKKACDGFVAVNTSTRLTKTMLGLDAGGVSGGPLLPIAVETIRIMRTLIGPEMLIIGCGGITQPGDALTLQQAGAELIELYSGMIYSGPGLPAECAKALKEGRA
jgi:dihydroorotate dehydrogenase